MAEAARIAAGEINSPTAADDLLKERNTFYKAGTLEAGLESKQTRVHFLQDGRNSIDEPSVPVPPTEAAKLTPYLQWLRGDGNARSIVITFNCKSSFSKLVATEEQFRELESYCPSFEELKARISVFGVSKDQRNVFFPPIYHRPIFRKGSGIASSGFELLYGFDYYEQRPRNKHPGIVDWPLRRAVIYHQWQRAGQDGGRERSLWLLFSPMKEVEDFLIDTIASEQSNARSHWLDSHVTLHDRVMWPWRLLIDAYADAYREDINNLYPEEVRTMTEAKIDESWAACVRRTVLADSIEDSLLALDASMARLMSLKSHLQDRSHTVSSSSGDLVSVYRLQTSLHCQMEMYQSSRRDLQVLLRKVDRTASPYSRLAELRSENFDRIMQELQASTAAANDLNKAWEDQKKVMDRQNNINSNIGRFLGILGASLLPVGFWGSFFSISKLVDDTNWWYWLVAVGPSWLAILLAVWIWGASGKKSERWWRYEFWKGTIAEV